MLYIFVVFLVLIPVFCGIGKISEFFLGKLWNGVSGVISLGVMSVSLVWTLLAFFIPLNIYLEITTIIIGLIFFIYFQYYKELWIFLIKNYKIFISVVFVVVFSGSFYPFILDHFGYYIPTINWLKGYGLVKGISNVDLTLGQMSVWHILQAGFSSVLDIYFRLNTIVLMVYVIYIIEKKSWIHLVLLPILFLFIQSPSPDLPVIIFSLMVLNEILLKNDKYTLIFAFSIFVFVIKPTMLWLPLLAFLYSLFYYKNLKFIYLGVFILFLFFAKNIWTFGFPVFPVQVMDFGVAWKPNADLLKESSEIAILKTFDMQYELNEINNFTFFEYFKNWLFLEGIKSKINILFILSIIILGVFSIIKNNKTLYLLFISILVKSIFVLLFSAQYRFFIDVFFVVFFILFYNLINRKSAVFGFSVLSAVVVFIFIFPSVLQTHIPSFRVGYFMKGFDKNQFMKPSNYKLNRYEIHKIGNFQFNLTTDYPFAFDTPAPAISYGSLEDYYKVGMMPQLIDNNVKKGFIWREISKKEREKIKNILEEYERKENDK